MKLSWDEAKRRATLEARGVDFASAALVFEGMHFTRADLRRDYGEERYVTAGFIDQRLVILVWTPRDGGRHIISMRKANEREQKAFAQAVQSRAG